MSKAINFYLRKLKHYPELIKTSNNRNFSKYCFKFKSDLLRNIFEFFISAASGKNTPFQVLNNYSQYI